MYPMYLGVLWVGGYTFGGVYGIAHGWKAAASPHYLVRFNSVMNGLSKYGSTLGNSLAIIGINFTS